MPAALVLIDLQQGLLSEEAAAFEGQRILGNAAGLLAIARRAGIPVFHVQHDGGKGDVLCRGTAGWQHHPAVAPGPGEAVVEKIYSSSFDGTELDALLKGAGVDRLVIAGMQTEFCVDTTCRSAAERGYQVVLVSDAHTTFDSAVLPAEKIIAHHNQTLGGGFVQLTKAADVRF